MGFYRDYSLHDPTRKC